MYTRAFLFFLSIAVIFSANIGIAGAGSLTPATNLAGMKEVSTSVGLSVAIHPDIDIDLKEVTKILHEAFISNNIALVKGNKGLPSLHVLIYFRLSPNKHLEPSIEVALTAWTPSPFLPGKKIQSIIWQGGYHYFGFSTNPRKQAFQDATYESLRKVAEELSNDIKKAGTAK